MTLMLILMTFKLQYDHYAFSYDLQALNMTLKLYFDMHDLDDFSYELVAFPFDLDAYSYDLQAFHMTTNLLI